MRSIILVISLLVACACAAAPPSSSFLSTLYNVTVLASTVPANGDVNPYGVFVVPQTIGNLTQGNILVSNFNNASNLQGTGTTIVQISPDGTMSLFAMITDQDLAGSCPGGIGLTTALVVLERGWVLVGSLPTTDGTSATMQPGCIIVLDALGKVHANATIAQGLINGPWDATVKDLNDTAYLFVTNVLNGNVAGSNGSVVNQGTVVRITLSVPAWTPEPSMAAAQQSWVLDQVVIGSGFGCRGDPAALVLGPTGLALSDTTLYVAYTLNNSIVAFDDALNSTTASSGRPISSSELLNAPLGAVITPNGNILVTNGNDGNMVEINPGGEKIASMAVDNTTASGLLPGAGCLFGLAIAPSGVYFVDDCTNTLNLLH